MLDSARPGTLIALEGIDGTGKTTQAALLEAWATGLGFEVVCTKEPTQGPWGRRLRDSRFTARLSPQEELDCFVQDRREHVEQLIAPSLQRGAVVVIDRYYFSTVAYQGARGLDPAEVLALNQRFAPRPDLVFLFDLEPVEGLRRIAERGAGQDLFESIEELTKARAIFLALEEPRLVRLDATLGVLELHARILFELLGGPLGARLPKGPALDKAFLLDAAALAKDPHLTLEQQLERLYARARPSA